MGEELCFRRRFVMVRGDVSSPGLRCEDGFGMGVDSVDPVGPGRGGYNSDFDSFYMRRLKKRMDDWFSHPVAGVPGWTIMVLDRVSHDNNITFELTST